MAIYVQVQLSTFLVHPSTVSHKCILVMARPLSRENELLLHRCVVVGFKKTITACRRRTEVSNRNEGSSFGVSTQTTTGCLSVAVG